MTGASLWPESSCSTGRIGDGVSGQVGSSDETGVVAEPSPLHPGDRAIPTAGESTSEGSPCWVEEQIPGSADSPTDDEKVWVQRSCQTRHALSLIHI